MKARWMCCGRLGCLQVLVQGHHLYEVALAVLARDDFTERRAFFGGVTALHLAAGFGRGDVCCAILRRDHSSAADTTRVAACFGRDGAGTTVAVSANALNIARRLRTWLPSMLCFSTFLPLRAWIRGVLLELDVTGFSAQTLMLDRGQAATTP